MQPSEAREDRILSFRSLVKKIANHSYRMCFHSFELEDLVSVGWIATIRAVDAFNPQRYKNLTASVAFKIKCAMIDHMRAHGNYTRRGKVRLGEDGLSLDQFNVDQLSLPQLVLINTHAIEAEIDANIILRRTRAGKGIKFNKMGRKYPATERDVAICTAHYCHSESTPKIASRFGLHQTRIDAVCRKTLAKCRAAAA